MTTRKREQKAAKQYNADRVIRSGGLPWWKEDLKGTHFLFQHKWAKPGTKSHRLTLKDLEELRRNSIDEGLEPAYIVDFEDSHEDYIIITKSLFDRVFNND